MEETVSKSENIVLPQFLAGPKQLHALYLVTDSITEKVLGKIVFFAVDNNARYITVLH